MLSNVRCPVSITTVFQGCAASSVEVICKLHIVIYRIIDRFDAIGVVIGEFRIVWSLNGLIDDTVDYSESVKDEGDAFDRSVADQFVLVVKVVVKGRAVMTAVRLGPKIECLLLVSNLGIQLGKRIHKALQYVPGSHCRQICGRELRGVNDGIPAVNSIRSVLLLSGIGVQTTGFFLRIGKSHAKRLGKEQQVGNFVPCVRI